MENQRIRLSKMMLQTSLTQLLAEKSIHKVSVREICDLAEINRTTFYKYYGSQYDLLKDMENEVLLRIDAYLYTDKQEPEFNVQALVQITTYLQDNLDLCRLLINNTVDTEFPEKLFNLSMIRRLLDEHLANQYPKSDIDYGHQFVVNGGFGIIKAWINKETRESPESIANTLVNIIFRLFKTK